MDGAQLGSRACSTEVQGLGSMRSAPIRLAAPTLGEPEERAVLDVLRSGWLTNGPVVQEFEKRYAELSLWRHAVATSSATAAARLVFDYLVGAGELRRLVVPDLTFCGPAIQALHAGVDVLVTDIDPATLMLDRWAAPAEGEWLMPTDYAGRPSRLSGPKVIFDSAAFHGPFLKRRGYAAITSFYANKVVTCAEGGMLLTDDPELAAYARRARLHGIAIDAHGRDAKSSGGLLYDVEVLGQKSNLTDVAAAIGLAQLARLPELLRRRQELADEYARNLPAGAVPAGGEPGRGSNYIMPVLLGSPAERDATVAALRRAGIGVSLHYPPLTTLTALKGRIAAEPTPVTHDVAGRMVSLPMHGGLTRENVREICATIARALEP